MRIRCNLPIPGLTSLPEADGADLEIELGAIPSRLDDSRRHAKTKFVSEEQEHGKPVLQVLTQDGGNYYRFHYYDDTEFVIDCEGSRLWARWPDSLTLEETALCLLGPILGFVLQLRGTTCLHASAVAIGGSALALVGPAGAGKSTTAAFLAGQGYPVISEDVVTLAHREDMFYVVPGYPRIRLWPSSACALYGESHGLPPLFPNYDKLGLDLIGRDLTFQTVPLRLAAIYLLGARSMDSSAPALEKISPRDQMISLVNNVYSKFFTDKKMKSVEFEKLARVVASLHVRKIIPHGEISCLPGMCEMIIKDFANICDN